MITSTSQLASCRYNWGKIFSYLTHCENLLSIGEFESISENHTIPEPLQINIIIWIILHILNNKFNFNDSIVQYGDPIGN